MGNRLWLTSGRRCRRHPQPPHSDPFRVVSTLDLFLYPIENHALERQPTIGGDLNDIHVADESRHLEAEQIIE